MKEKQFKKWIAIRFAIIIAIYLVASLFISRVMDNKLESKCLNLSNMLHYSPDQLDLDRLIVSVDREDLLEVTGPYQKNNDIYMNFESKMNGAGKVYVEVEDPEVGYGVESAYITVNERGFLVDSNTGNFSHYRSQQFWMILFILAAAAILWAGYIKSVKELRFSYQSIFCVGLALWVSVLALMMVISFVENEIMLNVYGTLAGASGSFSTVTSPLILIFAILLSISNISLIRHEGVRFANVLGILLSFTMVFGFLAIMGIGELVSSGSEFQMDLWGALMGTMETIYVLLECFLIGAIICGSRAATNKPAYDKDYIVILGCMIRPDGTLYPLLRGRVDKAIAFYKEQFAANGKKAIFIPSGGQGSDEPMPEGEAMKNYLLEQGIEPEQIRPETKSVNTIENMKFSMQLIEEGKKAVFSTTNYHVFRSGIIANSVGFEADGIGSKTKWYFWPNAYIREVIGMLSYKWKTLVILLIPIVAFLSTIRFMF